MLFNVFLSFFALFYKLFNFYRAELNGTIVERPYTPISYVTLKGKFELVVKIYFKCEKFPEGGKMS